MASRWNQVLLDARQDVPCRCEFGVRAQHIEHDGPTIESEPHAIRQLEAYLGSFIKETCVSDVLRSPFQETVTPASKGKNRLPVNIRGVVPSGGRGHGHRLAD
ncbi:hypothetical protein GCM10009817_39690 [Terrabacter lapilli]|uniref:Uncharacterized protein n=1 Tax=Terrabacter lapilli TaxID=436231 RepID=A0ABP5ED61_9MICO